MVCFVRIILDIRYIRHKASQIRAIEGLQARKEHGNYCVALMKLAILLAG